MGHYKSQFNQPDKDAGWGLIFRLNDLWSKVDYRAETGNYDGWEIVLDRIYSNLLYRNPVEIVYDDAENIIEVELCTADRKIREFLKRKIGKAKTEIINAMKKRSGSAFRIAKQKHYENLLLYDQWLRKFMQEHSLYLKEIESNPSKALFGGAFR